MIYTAALYTVDGKERNHPGRPSRKFLLKHPEFTDYHETGKYNEYYYRTKYKINNATLIEISDSETHQRNYC